MEILLALWLLFAVDMGEAGVPPVDGEVSAMDGGSGSPPPPPPNP